MWWKWWDILVLFSNFMLLAKHWPRYHLVKGKHRKDAVVEWIYQICSIKAPFTKIFLFFKKKKKITFGCSSLWSQLQFELMTRTSPQGTIYPSIVHLESRSFTTVKTCFNAQLVCVVLLDATAAANPNEMRMSLRSSLKENKWKLWHLACSKVPSCSN